MTRNIFVNLPVRNLEKSMAFFRALGFDFNPKFTDDKAACMIINGDAYVMLLSAPFFETFTRRPISDATKATEALFAVSADSRAAVDAMVEQAVAAGGKVAMAKSDQGFMYGGSFYDLDDHHWEVLWMDPAALG